MGFSVYYAAVGTYDAALLDGALEKIITPLSAEYGGIAGKKVMIKPNLLEYRKENDPATVHPALLTALCRYLAKHNAAQISVIENPAVRTAEAIVESMGIMPELKRLDVNVKNCANYQKTAMPPECRYHQLEIASEYRKYDLVIDFAKAKTHAMMTLTCGVKNLFGLIRGSERLAWHLAVGRNFDDFADMLLDIYCLVKPQITLLDAIIGMEGNGPGSGDAVQLGFLCAADDALMLDESVAKYLGVTDMPVLKMAAKRGLTAGYQEFGEIPEVKHIRLPDVPSKRLEWGVYFPVKLRNLLRSMLLSRPVIDRKKCISCGLCAQKCPPQSLKMVNGTPVFDYPECIRCFCCQEFCPKGAITTAPSFWLKCLSNVEKLLRKTASLIRR